MFLDANVLIAAAMGGGGSIQIWRLEQVSLVSSEFAAEEARFNLARKPDASELLARLSDLLDGVELVAWPQPHHELSPEWRLPDPNDVPIAEAAVVAGCEFLLSLDSACFGHLYGRVLDGITVLKPGKFLDLLGL